MSEMPPIFDIDAFDHSLMVEEIDWTHSEEAASFAFKYGWMRGSDAKDLIEKIKRLRARVEELERVRAAARALLDYWDNLFREDVCYPVMDDKFQVLRAALKEPAP